MLLKILELLGPLPVVLALLLFVAQHSLRRRHKHQLRGLGGQTFFEDAKTAEPPSLRAPIAAPFAGLGHALGFFRRGPEYLTQLCLSTALPAFSVDTPVAKLCIAQPALHRALPRTPHLALLPLVASTFQRPLAFGAHSCQLLRGEGDGQGSTSEGGFAAHLLRLFHEEFIPAPGLAKYVQRIDADMAAAIARLAPTPAAGRDHDKPAMATIRIEEFVFAAFAGSFGRSVWGAGPDSPFASPAFVTHLRILLGGLGRLSGPAVWATARGRRLLEARRHVRTALARHGAGRTYAADSFLGRVRAAITQYGATEEDWTDFQMLLILGTGPNVGAATTWMVHHLLADEAWLLKVREEMDQFVGCQGGDIDLSKVTERCPKLMASWLEALRCHSGFSVGRLATEDTVLAGRWLVKKGGYVVAPVRPHHVDPDIWGGQVGEFVAARFLNPLDGSLAEKQRRKLRMFGLFGSLCPGRFLSVNLAMAFMIRLLSTMELKTLHGGPHIPPPEAKDSVAGNPAPAWDIEVSVARRKNAFKDIRMRVDGESTIPLAE